MQFPVTGLCSLLPSLRAEVQQAGCQEMQSCVFIFGKQAHPAFAAEKMQQFNPGRVAGVWWAGSQLQPGDTPRGLFQGGLKLSRREQWICCELF